MNKNEKRQTWVREKINEIIVDQLQISKDYVTPESDLYNDLGADSLDIVELTMAIEEEFNLDIPDEVLESYAPRCTVANVYEYVEKMVLV